MKKLFALSLVAGLLVTACGPSQSAEELRIQDSLKQDSILKAQEDSIAAAAAAAAAVVDSTVVDSTAAAVK